jgi:DNA modification methylase
MKNQQVIQMAPSELKVSEHYERVYGKNEIIDQLLKETIQKEGIKEPLVITHDNKIVSGVLRWRIAMELSQNPEFSRKFQLIPIIYTDEEDSDTAIIIHNQGRTKTYTQKLKEFKILKDEFLPGRGYRADLKVSQAKNKESLEIVLGESMSTLNRLLYIDANIENACKGKMDLITLKWNLLDKGKLSVTGLKKWVEMELQTIQPFDSTVYKDGTVTLLNKNCSDLSDLKNKSVHCVLTSPPYWDMVTYNNGKDEHGKEKEVGTYIENISKLLDGVKSKLTENGSILVNISDVVKKGEMCLVPERLVLAMNNLGWKLNTTIVWSKVNPPFTSKDIRPNPSHEYIFQFYLGKKPHYDASWIKDDNDIEPIRYGDKRGEVNLKSSWSFNPDSWVIETAVNNPASLKKALSGKGMKLSHPAMMNEFVASILIKTFTRQGELVADLFNGVNTSGILCRNLGRNFVGYELNPEYFAQAVVRTKLAQKLELSLLEAA